MSSRRGKARPTSSTRSSRRGRPAMTRRWSCGRHSPGCHAFDIMSMPDESDVPVVRRGGRSRFIGVALAHVDPAFAMYQLIRPCRESVPASRTARWHRLSSGTSPALNRAGAGMGGAGSDRRRRRPRHRLPQPDRRQAAAPGDAVSWHVQPSTKRGPGAPEGLGPHFDRTPVPAVRDLGPMPTVHDTRLNGQHADRMVPAGIPAGPWTRPYVHREAHDIGGKLRRGLG